MNENIYRPTLFIEALWPRTGLARETLLVLLGSWLVGLAAQIEIPLLPVPVTGQTFGVLLVGALLGKRLGALSILAYLAQGTLGLPLFAGGAAGIVRLTGPTGGYLVGFVPAAFVVGWLSERGWDRRLTTAALAMSLGNGVIYALGLAWLTRFVGPQAVLQVGLLPFLVGDLLKVGLAALTLPWGWALLNARRDT